MTKGLMNLMKALCLVWCFSNRVFKMGVMGWGDFRWPVGKGHLKFGLRVGVGKKTAPVALCDRGCLDWYVSWLGFVVVR